MKILVAMMILGASVAQADGFVCETLERDLNVKVYNTLSPDVGTRTAAVMVFSDPSIQQGRQTIARFTDANGTLTNTGARYDAKVDLRYADSGRAGELISGTKLGALSHLYMNVGFYYSTPVKKGEALWGKLVLVKRNGERIDRDLSCARYLKD